MRHVYDVVDQKRHPNFIKFHPKREFYTFARNTIRKLMRLAPVGARKHENWMNISIFTKHYQNPTRLIQSVPSDPLLGSEIAPDEPGRPTGPAGPAEPARDGPGWAGPGWPARPPGPAWPADALLCGEGSGKRKGGRRRAGRTPPPHSYHRRCVI